MSFKEILSLQVGHYANHVGAHLWNIQESSFVYKPSDAGNQREICHDVLYREGENRSREVTFTPRLIAFDLKGSLRTLKQAGQLYDEPGCSEGDEIQWSGDVTMHTEQIGGSLSYMQSIEMEEHMGDRESGNQSSKDNSDEEDEDGKKVLRKKKVDKVRPDDSRHTLDNYDDSVTVWSDYLGTNFHPKSVHVVEEFRHQDELRPFDLYPAANEILQNYETSCEWEDRIHFFAEECDHLQGFHVLMDTHDGFGGLAGGLLKYLEDEFPGKGVLTYGFTPSNVPDDGATVRASRIINSALSFESACAHSSLFIPTSLAKGLWRVLESPVSFPNLTYKNIAYHTSAIIASAIETASVPYRLDSGSMNLTDITHSFNTQGRKLAALNTSFPLGLYEGESLTDFFTLFCQSQPKYPWQSITPHTTGSAVPFLQSVVVRGINDTQLPTDTDPRKLPSHLIGAHSTKELVHNWLEEKSLGNQFALNCINTPMKTVIPFPHVFTDRVNVNGLVSSQSRPENVGVESVPLMTSLQSSPELGGVVEQLHTAAGKMTLKKHHRYTSMGLEEDDYIETLENLKSLGNSYNLHVEAL